MRKNSHGKTYIGKTTQVGGNLHGKSLHSKNTWRKSVCENLAWENLCMGTGLHVGRLVWGKKPMCGEKVWISLHRGKTHVGESLMWGKNSWEKNLHGEKTLHGKNLN